MNSPTQATAGRVSPYGRNVLAPSEVVAAGHDRLLR